MKLTWPPAGWTLDGATPANVDTHGGAIDNAALSGNSSTGQYGISTTQISVSETGGPARANMNPNGTIYAAAKHGACLNALADAGADAALDCAALPIVNLPTSDPHIAGALWNNAGTPAISTG